MRLYCKYTYLAIEKNRCYEQTQNPHQGENIIFRHELTYNSSENIQ